VKKDNPLAGGPTSPILPAPPPRFLRVLQLESTAISLLLLCDCSVIAAQSAESRCSREKSLPNRNKTGLSNRFPFALHRITPTFSMHPEELVERQGNELLSSAPHMSITRHEPAIFIEAAIDT